MKILIVDDSIRMRKLIKAMLKQNQSPTEIIEFYECNDGCYALEEYEKIHPDWVLMDIAMKKMNGLDASALIRNRFPDAKIMIVTDYDDVLFREKAKLYGINNYILKENLSQINDIIYINPVFDEKQNS